MEMHLRDKLRSFLNERRVGAPLPNEVQIITNIHGLMTYPSDPKPIFVAWDNWNASRGIDLGDFEKEFSAMIDQGYRLTERDQIAFSLFNTSFFQPIPDSRFLLLMTSIEVLIDPQPKSREAIEKVDDFIDQVNSSALDKTEKQSLVGSLRWLRDESINQAGKRLAEERLGGKIYEGKAAKKFFTEVYDIRSRLVHGSEDF